MLYYSFDGTYAYLSQCVLYTVYSVHLALRLHYEFFFQKFLLFTANVKYLCCFHFCLPVPRHFLSLTLFDDDANDSIFWCIKYNFIYSHIFAWNDSRFICMIATMIKIFLKKEKSNCMNKFSQTHHNIPKMRSLLSSQILNYSAITFSLLQL